MRRKDREVTDFAKIAEIIEDCEIIRIGLADGDFPYIVPVNYGYELDGEQVYFYIHGAMAGRKYELMTKTDKCSFEIDDPIKLDADAEAGSATMRFRSLMGTASFEFLEGEERLRVLQDLILDQNLKTKNFPYKALEKQAERTAVAKLTVLSMTAKINPIPQGK